MISFELIHIFTQLQQPETRQQGLKALATTMNATEVFIFGKDVEIGIFLPAQGLPQTLRDGVQWHAFLKQVEQNTFLMSILPAPDGSERLAYGIADVSGFAILVFLGIELQVEQRDQIAAILPLLSAKLVIERTAQSAAGHAAVARDANRLASSLNVALEVNRRELQKAFELGERELVSRRAAEEELRKADRRKDEFLAMLAHELRNPLAPISTAAELLTLFLHDEKKVLQVSEIIKRQVGHMTKLVDDLLDVSRVTRGLVQLQKEELDLKEIVSLAIEQARPLIDAREHAFNLRFDTQQLKIVGDRTRLIQALSNVLNNAAKYTPKGGEITLRIEGRDTRIKICIEDNGIGIESTLLPNIFDLFTQAKRTPDRSQGGLGIGLALVKNIVGMHGGHVDVLSQGAGKGSIFSIELPRLENESSFDKLKNCEEKADAEIAKRVLIVDDNLDAAKSLAWLLEAQGHYVTVKEDARSALGEVEKNGYQLFILDIGLPDMSGYELLRRLRQHSSLKNAIFIALTGYGQAHDRALSDAAGFDYHFVKPITPQQLAKIFLQ